MRRWFRGVGRPLYSYSAGKPQNLRELESGRLHPGRGMFKKWTFNLTALSNSGIRFIVVYAAAERLGASEEQDARCMRIVAIRHDASSLLGNGVDGPACYAVTGVGDIHGNVRYRSVANHIIVNNHFSIVCSGIFYGAVIFGPAKHVSGAF